MGISHYIKEIGRGKDGARALSREQATDLFGQVLDGAVTDLEVGAFCLAMRIKGETPEEMAGFLDATRERTLLQGSADLLPVVLPSYNGAACPCWCTARPPIRCVCTRPRCWACWASRPAPLWQRAR